jgi:hypothetical protein
MSNCSRKSAQTFVHPQMQIHSLEVNVLYFEFGLSFDGFWDNVILKLLYEDVVGFVVRKQQWLNFEMTWQ